MNQSRRRVPQYRPYEPLQAIEDSFINLIPLSKERHREDISSSIDLAVTTYTTYDHSEDADYSSEDDFTSNSLLIDYTLSIESHLPSSMIEKIDSSLSCAFPLADSATVYHLWPLVLLQAKLKYTFLEILNYLKSLTHLELEAIVFSWNVYPKNFPLSESSYIVDHFQISDILSALNYLLTSNSDK